MSAYKAIYQYNRIAMVLAEHNKSMQWLADELNCSISAVSSWCANRQQPTIDKLFKIALLFDIEARDLLVTGYPQNGGAALTYKGKRNQKKNL